METDGYLSVADERGLFEYQIIGPFDPRHIWDSDSGILRLAVRRGREYFLPEQHVRISCRQPLAQRLQAGFSRAWRFLLKHQSTMKRLLCQG